MRESTTGPEKSSKPRRSTVLRNEGVVEERTTVVRRTKIPKLLPLWLQRLRATRDRVWLACTASNLVLAAPLVSDVVKERTRVQRV